VAGCSCSSEVACIKYALTYCCKLSSTSQFARWCTTCNQLGMHPSAFAASEGCLLQSLPVTLCCCCCHHAPFSIPLHLCRHNSHHAFPQSARHGLEWYEIDLTWYVICILKALGIVWDVHVPSEKAKSLKRRQPAPIKLTAKAE
jgi:hypothetical protein